MKWKEEFKSNELECCINSLSARRLVVPNPAPASSTAQTIWLLTQTQMNMGTVAQQQQNRKVDIQFIQDPDSVLRTDGCYCTRPRVELAHSFFDLQARATSEIAVADLSDSENR